MPLVADPAVIAAVQDILKEVWTTDALQSQLLEDTVLLDWMDDVTEFTDSDGLKASVPLKVGRTGGVSARGVGQKLAPPDHQRPGKATYNYKNLYLQIMVEGPVVARMETNRQAVVREIDWEVNSGIEDFRRDFCRQLHRAGNSQITIAALPGNASSTTLDLGASNLPVLDRGWLYEGQVLDIGTSANSDLDATGVRINSVDDDASPSLVLDNAVAVTANSHISLYGNRIDATSYEVDGLESIVSDTASLGGIDPTVAGKNYWKSVVLANGGTNRALSLSLLNNLYRKLRQNGAKPSDLMGSLGMQQRYYELLQPQVRFGGDADLSAGAVDGPKFNHMTFHGDPDSLPERIYMLSKKALQMYSAGEVAWQNQTTGGDILAWRQDYDQFMARAAKYCNVGTNRRRSLGVLDDIAEPA
jgi:hypothetical protein